jgi:hypothetical protein
MALGLSSAPVLRVPAVHQAVGPAAHLLPHAAQGFIIKGVSGTDGRALQLRDLPEPRGRAAAARCAAGRRPAGRACRPRSTGCRTFRRRTCAFTSTRTTSWSTARTATTTSSATRCSRSPCAARAPTCSARASPRACSLPRGSCTTRRPSSSKTVDAASVTKAIRKTTRNMLAPIPMSACAACARWPTGCSGSRPPDPYSVDFIGHLVRMQEEIGTGGAGFRFIYAGFLQEAAHLLGQAAARSRCRSGCSPSATAGAPSRSTGAHGQGARARGSGQRWPASCASIASRKSVLRRPEGCRRLMLALKNLGHRYPHGQAPALADVSLDRPPRLKCWACSGRTARARPR